MPLCLLLLFTYLFYILNYEPEFPNTKIENDHLLSNQNNLSVLITDLGGISVKHYLYTNGFSRSQQDWQIFEKDGRMVELVIFSSIPKKLPRFELRVLVFPNQNFVNETDLAIIKSYCNLDSNEVVTRAYLDTPLSFTAFENCTNAK